MRKLGVDDWMMLVSLVCHFQLGAVQDLAASKTDFSSFLLALICFK